MSSLRNQLSAFQRDASSAATRLSRSNLHTTGTQQHASTSSTATGTNNAPSSQQPEQRRNVVFSQPADTGTGRHMMTQVSYAVEYLKGKDGAISFKDIWDYLSIRDRDGDDVYRRQFEHVLQQHPKIEYDRKGFGGKGSYRFRPTHNVRSADDLLAFLQRQPTAQGILVRELKEGWPGALETIDTLEREHKILVTRNKKDQTPKMVWPDDPSLRHPVDSEFVELWHKIPLPKAAADLRRELVDFGMTPTSQVKAPVQAQVKDRKKRAARKGGRTTNTHMLDVLKDFSHLRR